MRIIELARAQQLHVLVGGMTSAMPKHCPAQQLGFRHAGTITQAGYKFGRWLDLAFYQLTLSTPRSRAIVEVAMYELIIANKNYSTWSMRPWVLMRALGIEFTERAAVPPQSWGRRHFATYARRQGALPGGRRDARVGLAFHRRILAERHVGVWPLPAADRAWARSAAAEMHSGFQALRNECSMSVGIRVPRSQSPALRADLRRESMWADGLARHGGPYLGGARFTAVDAFFAPVASRIQTYGLVLENPAAAYARHLLQHEAVREWMEAGVRETWRDAPHETDCLANGELLQDLRA